MTAVSAGSVYEGLARTYAFLFARASMQPVNKLLFHLALRGQGFNNGWQMDRSGEKRFLTKVAALNPGLCVDVGANRGDYAEAVLTTTGAHVIAFEPLPTAFEILRRVGDRFPGRLTAANVGVGNVNASLELNFGDTDTESELASFCPEVNEIDYVGARNVNSMTVPVVTLDSYFDEHEVDGIDLIKIDTEGFEHEVLQGARRTIEKYQPRFIQVEYNLHQLFRGHSLWSLSTLVPGYTPHQLLPHGGGLRRVDPKRPESNTFCFSNFVFIRDNSTSPVLTMSDE